MNSSFQVVLAITLFAVIIFGVVYSLIRQKEKKNKSSYVLDKDFSTGRTPCRS